MIKKHILFPLLLLSIFPLVADPIIINGKQTSVVHETGIKATITEQDTIIIQTKSNNLEILLEGTKTSPNLTSEVQAITELRKHPSISSKRLSFGSRNLTCHNVAWIGTDATVLTGSEKIDIKNSLLASLQTVTLKGSQTMTLTQAVIQGTTLRIENTSGKGLIKSIEGTIDQNSNTPCVLNGTIDFQDNDVNLTISGLSNIRIVLNEAAQ